MSEVQIKIYTLQKFSITILRCSTNTVKSLNPVRLIGVKVKLEIWTSSLVKAEFGLAQFHNVLTVGTYATSLRRIPSCSICDAIFYGMSIPLSILTNV